MGMGKFVSTCALLAIAMVLVKPPPLGFFSALVAAQLMYVLVPLAILLIILFAVALGWLPAGGMAPSGAGLGVHVQYLLLPIATLTPHKPKSACTWPEEVDEPRGSPPAAALAKGRPQSTG